MISVYSNIKLRKRAQLVKVFDKQVHGTSPRLEDRSSKWAGHIHDAKAI